MIRLVLLLLLIAAFLAASFLPWWGILVLVGGLALVGLVVVKVFGGRLFRLLFSIPFRAKGRALSRASAVVHSIAPVPAGEIAALRPAADAAAEADASREEEEDDEDGVDTPPKDARFFDLEVTIVPSSNAAGGSFSTWELGELLLVKPGAKGPMDDGEEDDAIRLDRLEVLLDGSFQKDEGYKLPGPQRLRARIAVPPDLERLKFRYYFEDFGEVSLPTDTPSA